MELVDFPALIRYIDIYKKLLHQPRSARGAQAGEASSIKNDILAVYTRFYSAIAPFQTEGCAEYILCRVGGELRLIVQARRTGEEKARVAQCELHGVQETTARGLLQFLYENAVSVENVCDIVQDVCPAV